LAVNNLLSRDDEGDEDDDSQDGYMPGGWAYCYFALWATLKIILKYS